MKKFEILISTCCEGIMKVEDVFKEVICNDIKVTIVHQLLDNSDTQEQKEIKKKLKEIYSEKINIITDPHKGLSRSRNLAIKNSTAEYLIISDDDIIIIKKNINDIYNELIQKKLDIALCRILTPAGEWYKNYKKYSNRIYNSIQAMSASSMEMIIRKDFVYESGILFDEKFGLGTSLPSCEEFIFLSDCIKNGAQAERIRHTLNIHPPESSGSNFTDKNIVRAKSAAFKRVFGKKFGLIITVLFFIKKIPKVGILKINFLFKYLILEYLNDSK